MMLVMMELMPHHLNLVQTVIQGLLDVLLLLVLVSRLNQSGMPRFPGGHLVRFHK
jgi:hypothetical protein